MRQMDGGNERVSLEHRVTRWLFIGATALLIGSFIVGVFIDVSWLKLAALGALFSACAAMLFGLLGVKVPGIMRDTIKTIGEVAQSYLKRRSGK